jgi:hypothetical protein
LPFISETVHCTVVAPSGKGVDGRSFVKLGTEQLSVAEGIPIFVNVAPHEVVLVPVIIGAGQLLMTGASLSKTVMICVQVDELPSTSVAVQITVVVPVE